MDRRVSRKKDRTVVRALGLALIGVLLAASCGGEDEPAGGDELTRVRIVEIPGLAQMFYPHLADDEGFFEEEGLEAEFVSAQSGPALVTTILGGNAELGMAGPQLIWPAMEKGEEILVLAGAAKLNYLIATCGPDMPTPNIEETFPQNILDLEGNAVGAIAEGTQTERFALQLIEAAGLRPGEDVDVLYVGAASTAIPACAAGRIDAYVFNPPAQALLGEEGKDYKVIADALAPSSGGLFEGFISDMFATTSSYAQNEPETVIGFCEALVQARDFAEDPANFERVVERLASYTNLPVERVRAIWEGGLADSIFLPVDEKTWARQADALEGELSNYVPDYAQHVHNDCTDIVSNSN